MAQALTKSDQVTVSKKISVPAWQILKMLYQRFLTGPEGKSLWIEN